MDSLLFIIVILLIACFMMSLYQTNDIIQLQPDEDKDASDEPIKHLKIEKSIITNKECTTKEQKEIYLYEEDVACVENKGFINELIYKPSLNTTDISKIYETEKILSDTPLNDDSYTVSQDLPIGNININYLLNKNTSKLSM